jgi:hypothetical protein
VTGSLTLTGPVKGRCLLIAGDSITVHGPIDMTSSVYDAESSNGYRTFVTPRLLVG